MPFSAPLHSLRPPVLRVDVGLKALSLRTGQGFYNISQDASSPVCLHSCYSSQKTLSLRTGEGLGEGDFCSVILDARL